MKTGFKAVSWVCITSILLTGCYTSTLVDPTGDQKEKLYSQRISYVVMKDSTKYEFIVPPEIVDSMIVGEGRVAAGDSLARQVSLPISDAAHVSVSKAEGGILALAVVGVVVLIRLVLITSGHGVKRLAP